MKISVVIPIYNAEKTLENTLSSVMKQTILPLEIICVNDGSTDNSLVLLEKFAKGITPVPIKIINKKNGGVSTARNAGIKASSGNWIAFLDADDIWHPDKIKIIKKYLTNDVFLVSHGFTLVDFIDVTGLSARYKKISLLDLLIKNRFVTPSVIIKNGYGFEFNETMRYAEDHDLWLRISEHYKSIFIDLPLVKLNRPVLSAGGASGNRWKMRLGEMKMYNDFFMRKKGLFFLIPFFTIFSFMKHIKQLVK